MILAHINTKCKGHAKGFKGEHNTKMQREGHVFRGMQSEAQRKCYDITKQKQKGTPTNASKCKD